MRSIWKGTISFGLVSIAVKLYAATEEKHIRFNQIHAQDGGRIRYRRTCTVCEEEVNYDDLARGYDLGGGEMVVLTDDDFAGLPLSTSHTIEVLEFVPADQVDPILYASAYYLEPDGAARKAYLLLRDALTKTDRVAIVKVALRQREHLATLRVRHSTLLLNTMLWPDEVREPAFRWLEAEVEARPAELAMAGSLIESMAADFNPVQYRDDYRSALQAVIDAKAAGRAMAQPEADQTAPTVAGDLMAALRASVDRARAARGAQAPRGERAARGERAGEVSVPATKARRARPTKTAVAAKAASPRAEPRRSPAVGRSRSTRQRR